MAQYLYIPKLSELNRIWQLCFEIDAIVPNDQLIVDFSTMTKITPFAALATLSKLNELRRRNPDLPIQWIGYEECGFAAHMGFFQAIGINYGKLPGEAAAGSHFLPITRVERKSLEDSAERQRLQLAVIIQRRSDQLASSLSRGNRRLAECLTYSIREILRNVFEHSGSNFAWISAVYWPSNGFVEVSILDEGIGVRAGLLSNPRLDVNSDADALMLCVQPGISGKYILGEKQKSNSEWENSGFGLYMTSRICQSGGSFVIASGNSAYHMSGDKRRIFASSLPGTAIRFRLNAGAIENIDDMLSALDRQALQIQKILQSVDIVSASKMARIEGLTD